MRLLRARGGTGGPRARAGSRVGEKPGEPHLTPLGAPTARPASPWTSLRPQPLSQCLPSPRGGSSEDLELDVTVTRVIDLQPAVPVAPCEAGGRGAGAGACLCCPSDSCPSWPRSRLHPESPAFLTQPREGCPQACGKVTLTGCHGAARPQNKHPQSQKRLGGRGAAD